MMDRRELLHRASMLLGGAISASAAAGILAGCAATPEEAPMPQIGPAGSFFTDAEMATVVAMANQIIPKTDTHGAIDVGVPGFIDRMMSGFYQEREQQIFRAGLVQVANDAKAMRGKSFAALTSDEQVELMKRYDREQFDYTRANANTSNPPPHYFRMMKELTIIGFCSSEAGATKLMNYQQTPGPFRGDVPLAEVGKASAL
jgi:gluconate 2-dehydrogenase gamma chain